MIYDIEITDKQSFYHGTVIVDGDRYSYVLCKHNKEKVFWTTDCPDERELIESEIWEKFNQQNSFVKE